MDPDYEGSISTQHRDSLQRGSQDMPLTLLQNYENNLQRPDSDFTVVTMRKKTSRPEKIEIESPTSQSVPLNFNASLGLNAETIPSNISAHVLFCALSKDFSKNLAYFVAPYRHADPKTPIVILCDSTPDEETRCLLDNFEHIYLIKGTPLLRKDLRRVRVHDATRTVCFAKNETDISDPSVDAPMMLSLLNIQAMCQDQNNLILVEFMHATNIRLIGKSGLSESYVSNLISTSSFPAENLIPAFAGGHVFNNSMFHSVLCQSYFETNLLSIIKMLLFFDNSKGHDGTPSANLFQIVLPKDGRYTGLTFDMMFTYLMLEYQCVCIGVYRNSYGSTTFQYVYLNPQSIDQIKDGDCLYVFGCKKPNL